VCYIWLWSVDVLDGQRGLQTSSGTRGRDLSKGGMKTLQSFDMSGATDIAVHPRRPAP